MMDYMEMTAHELEQKREELQNRMATSNNTAEIELLGMEIEAITDILDERDPLADE